MLPTHSVNLPPQQRQRLHVDFLANEAAYFQMRDQLLSRYRGQWVAVHNGTVVAAARDVLAVTEQAAAAGGHPYIALVGREQDAVFRVRHSTFAYDRSYATFPLPRITVTFWNHAETQSHRADDVIPDTGADLCVLPDADCAAFDLHNSPYFTAVSGGVLGSPVTTLVYRGKAEVDGKRVAAFIQPVVGATEWIVGRDVLNQHRILFDGPAGQVVIDP